MLPPGGREWQLIHPRKSCCVLFNGNFYSLVMIRSGLLEPYSQHFILFVTYDLVQYARKLHYT